MSTLTESFKQFFAGEKSSGILLILFTIAALLIVNLGDARAYQQFIHTPLAGLTLAHWVNDGLMAIFFLFIGLELEREIYSGELAEPRKAILPIAAAIGGVLAPALIHFSLNQEQITQAGFGIPMATDIAFALGALAILGQRVPNSLKVFVVAFAIADDLIAILVIALFYTQTILSAYLGASLIVLGLLFAMNRLRITRLLPYLLGGALLWLFMLKSGIHATLAGVLLAFAIPFSGKDNDAHSPSHRLEHRLHAPVSFLILPIFALVNTGITLSADQLKSIVEPNGLGIVLGLCLGKPVGILLASLLVIKSGFAKLPDDLDWLHIIGAGLLGGIGFTMSIFIANLAFNEQATLINNAKIAILFASLVSGLLGYCWLRFFTEPSSS